MLAQLRIPSRGLTMPADARDGEIAKLMIVSTVQQPWPPMLVEVVEDLDAAILDVANGPTARQQRRAMREALGAVYTLRSFREEPDKEAYRDAAKAADRGRVTEGLA